MSFVKQIKVWQLFLAPQESPLLSPLRKGVKERKRGGGVYSESGKALDSLFFLCVYVV